MNKKDALIVLAGVFAAIGVVYFATHLLINQGHDPILSFLAVVGFGRVVNLCAGLMKVFIMEVLRNES